jgi:hypothetical protein
MVTEKQIQEIIKMGVSKNTLSKMTLKEIKNLHESMVNSQGFVGINKPIGRMTSVKKSETKEQTTPQNTTPTSKTITSYEVKPNSKTMVNGVEVDTTGGKTKVTPVTETEMTEGKKKTNKKVEQNPFGICTTSLGLKGKKKDDYTKGEKKKFERCVLDVKKSLKEGKNPYEVILEQKMRDIVESNLRPTMTKKDLINSILESKTKEKTKEKEKTTTPTRKNPFKPAPDTEPRPKGSGTKEKEKTKEKERTTTNPRKNPFQPAPNTEPRPKGELPSYLNFGKMNIKLKGE